MDRMEVHVTRQARINVYGPYRRGSLWRVVMKSGGIQQAESFPTEAEAIAHRDVLRREIGTPPDIVGDLTKTLDQWVALLARCASDAASFVYAVRPVTGGLTKIGVATDPYARLVDIQHMGPVPLRVVGLAHGGYELESRLHSQNVECRSHGEWFDLDEPPMLFANGQCFGCRPEDT
jgi:hypothetical protein